MTLAGNSDKVKSNSRTLAGKIITVSGEEIAGVKITINESNETFYSDLTGNFHLPVKCDREYSLTIEGLGFEPKTIKSSEVSLFSEISLKEL